MYFLGEESGLSVDEEESRAAWLLLRLVSEGQLRCLDQLISWLVRELPMAGSSHRLERTIRDFDALEAHVRLAHLSLYLDKLKTCGAFIGGRRRETVL